LADEVIVTKVKFDGEDICCMPQVPAIPSLADKPFQWTGALQVKALISLAQLQMLKSKTACNIEL
jgi:hypothetical protein